MNLFDETVDTSWLDEALTDMRSEQRVILTQLTLDI